MAPEWPTYLHVISVVLGLGSFAVAAEVYSRFFARRNGRVLDGYLVSLGLAVCAGVVTMGVRPILGRTAIVSLAVGLPLGCLLGAVARWSDRAIVRAITRRNAASGRPRGLTQRTGAGRAVRVTGAPGALLLGGTLPRAAGAHRSRMPSPEGDPRQFPLLTIATVAVLEEGFFRGVLLRTALQPKSLLVATALVFLTLLAFSAAHVFFGWEHVLAKTPLGIAALASVLALGSLLPAVVAHLWFNVSVWRDMARLAGRER